MTRILYWNIENFSVEKFWSNAHKRKRGSSLTGQQAANDRRNLFIDALHLPNATTPRTPPDIIVIVELETGQTRRGRLATGNAGPTVQRLCALVRQQTNNAAWMAVPPVFVGPRESVVVLYDSTNYVFTGPNGWSGGAGGQTIQLRRGRGARNPQDYPQNWQGYLPANRTVPAGASHNVGKPERQLAARLRLTSAGGAGQPRSGRTQDFGRSRSPYCVTFARLHNGAFAEDLTLFAVHAPASPQPALSFMQKLAATREIVGQVGQNERRLVLGDFNLNLLDPNSNPAFGIDAAYNNLTNHNYSLAVTNHDIPPNPTPDGYPGFFGTHIKRKNKAKIWSNQNQNRYYCGYGYMNPRFSAFDNIFYTGNAPQQIGILNPVVGSPYDANRSPNSAQLWDFEIPQSMTQFQNVARTAPPHHGGVATAFRGWSNYGHIRSTSDHLPLLADFT